MIIAFYPELIIVLVYLHEFCIGFLVDFTTYFDKTFTDISMFNVSEDVNDRLGLILFHLLLCTFNKLFFL